MRNIVLGLFLVLLSLQSLSAQKVRVPSRSEYLDPINRVYPWHKEITASVFWVGEGTTERNKTHNSSSSWDVNWAKNFGGYDDPNPAGRVGFRPKAFRPKLNPFYIALPYNDVAKGNRHKREAKRVIPWFKAYRPFPGKSVCHGKWVHIYYKGRSCFAQWEDCGPWVTDDWKYVFQNKRPENKQNGGAGIDISPAVRDYLRVKSGEKVQWRFVPTSRVPVGPWRNYGKNNPFLNPKVDREMNLKRRYFEYLRKLRDK